MRLLVRESIDDNPYFVDKRRSVQFVVDRIERQLLNRVGYGSEGGEVVLNML